MLFGYNLKCYSIMTATLLLSLLRKFISFLLLVCLLHDSSTTTVGIDVIAVVQRYNNQYPGAVMEEE